MGSILSNCNLQMSTTNFSESNKPKIVKKYYYNRDEKPKNKVKKTIIMDETNEIENKSSDSSYNDISDL